MGKEHRDSMLSGGPVLLNLQLFVRQPRSSPNLVLLGGDFITQARLMTSSPVPKGQRV